MLSMNVVAANPARPSGAGLAGVQPAVRPPAYGSPVGAGATSASRAPRGPIFAASIYLLLLGVLDVAGTVQLHLEVGNDGSLNGPRRAMSGASGTTNGDRSRGHRP